MENISVYIMGKKYEVPKNLTIMKAMEYCGYKFVRGCGCRGGFCGACAIVYRIANDYKIKNGLACQTIVEKDMYIAQIPFFPANKALYNINKITPSIEEILKYYPEIYRCVSCNSCTKICPQSIEVMDSIQSALRGDIAKAADLSFDCIMCGLCAARCPAEIVQYNVALLCRRIYAKHIQKAAKHLSERLKEIKAGKYDKEIERLTCLEVGKLKELYGKRDIEPEEEV